MTKGAVTKAGDKLARQLKQAIADSGLSMYRVAKSAGIGPDVVSRFVSGTDIQISTAGKLVEALGLELKPR